MSKAKKKPVSPSTGKTSAKARKRTANVSKKLAVPLVLVIVIPLLLMMVLVDRSGVAQPARTTPTVPVIYLGGTPTPRLATSTPVSVSTVSTPVASPETPEAAPANLTATVQVSPSATRASETATPQATATAKAPAPTTAPASTATPAPAAQATATSAAVPVSTQPSSGAGAQSQSVTTSKRLIAVDPGHGGVYAGAVNTQFGVIEKDVNLRVGLAVAQKLRAAGFQVVMTRSGDSVVNTAGADVNGDGEVTVEDDLQARVDLINAAGAELVLSIHHNGSTSPMRGTMSIFCSDRPFGDRNRTLTSSLQAALIERLRGAGYADAVSLGIMDDSSLGRTYGHLSLLGPTMPILPRPAKMPGTVGEALFVSDDSEAALLTKESTIEAIAQAYVDAVNAYYAAY